jgi:hypothetical protein
VSDQKCHLEQARHNESLAAMLLDGKKYLDWVATVAFYAGVHYVESALTLVPGVGHSESSMPVDPVTKQEKCSLHNWRDDLVRKHFRGIYRNYKLLRTVSGHARYLKGNNKPAYKYYSQTDADGFLKTHLAGIKGGLKIP